MGAFLSQGLDLKGLASLLLLSKQCLPFVDYDKDCDKNGGSNNDGEV